MEKQRTPCEIYTRIMGYLRPVSHANRWKKSEFYTRKTFDVVKSMRENNNKFNKKYCN